jgi:superfamily II DNA/RNA helicase
MTSSFERLGVAADLAAALAEGGITEPFPVQDMTIPDALAGRDVCGKARTGSGKTLAFGLPLIERVAAAEPRRPTGLVLVPTRELAAQVHDVLAPLAAVRGVRLVAVYGGAPSRDQLAGLKRGVEIVVATPGRLIDLLQSDQLSLGRVETVVLDEADRMNDMGFRPQVEWILRHCPSGKQTLLFSATLDREVDSLVERHMSDPVFHSVEEDSSPGTLVHRFVAVHDLDKPKVVAAIAEHRDRTLVFVATKRNAERVTRLLRDVGVKVDSIHGDRPQDKRERALLRFTEGTLPVLVATDVAARGIDVEAIDVVVHYDPAGDEKTYLHRSGRTARAGETGLVVTLVLWNQHGVTTSIQRRLGIEQPIVEMFSNDPRLADLVAWDPCGAEATAGSG